MELGTEELINEFYHNNFEEFPHLTKEEFTEIVKCPFLHLKNHINEGRCYPVRLTGFGYFSVPIFKAKYRLSKLFHFLKTNYISPKSYYEMKEKIESYIAVEEKKEKRTRKKKVKEEDKDNATDEYNKNNEYYEENEEDDDEVETDER